MVTKSAINPSEVNWAAVENATEIRRTYMLTNLNGGPGIVFKMYKRSQFKLENNSNISSKYMDRHFRMLGKKDISRQSHADKSFKDICRERKLHEMMENSRDSYSAYKDAYVY